VRCQIGRKPDASGAGRGCLPAHSSRFEPGGGTVSANKSLELLGKHIGLFLDRKNVDVTVFGDPGEYLRQLRERIGIIDITPDDEAVPALQLSSA
jgi:hypothetical protein